jgi:hypothetical protein
MPEGYLLSANDRDKLQRLLATSPARGHDPDHHGLGDTSDIYVAKVQPNDDDTPGSIDALTPAADDENYDHPGCAVCDIYQVSITEEGYSLVAISGLSFPVYNITSSAIADDWILVAKSKSGHWMAVVGGAPAKTDIFQMIVDMDDDAYEGLANPLTDLNGSPSGFYYNDNGDTVDDNTIILYDPSARQPAWWGDWVEAEPIDDLSPYTDPRNYLDAHPNLKCYKIVRRYSTQLTFWGWTGADPIGQNSGAWCGLLINDPNGSTKQVFDGGLMLQGQAIPQYTIMRVDYDLNMRQFFVIGAPCGATGDA